MKSRTLATVIVLFVALGAAVLADTARIAVVTGVVRGLEVRPAGRSAWTRGQVWMQVGEGDALRTAAGQLASVMFADGTQMKMDEKTEVVVRANKLEARRGRIWLLVQGNKKPYQVTTPNAVAGIEGTELEVTVGDDGQTTVSVVKGTVAVSNSAGKMQVGSFQECEVRGHAAPARAVTKMRTLSAWTHGVRDYTDVKAQVEKNLVEIIGEAERSAATLKNLSKAEKLAALQSLLKRLNAQIAAFADMEPPPIYASAHGHRMLALDTLSVAVREMEHNVLVPDSDPRRVRALLARARQENGLAQKQYEKFGQLYEKVRSSLAKPD